MEAKKYIRRPVVIVIEALQFDGSNFAEVMEFVPFKQFGRASYLTNELEITSTEGWKFTVSQGDYIIKDCRGEYYSCTPDTFNLMYEEIANETHS